VPFPEERCFYEEDPPLDEKFKDPKDPLRLVFVCAMWLTGFDAPSCSTMYLDKPTHLNSISRSVQPSLSISMRVILRGTRTFIPEHRIWLRLNQ
jgi:hypothetical protein